MDLLGDVLIFAVGVFAFVGAHAGLAWLRQRSAALSILGILCAALVATTLARVVAMRTGSVVAAHLSTTALAPAFALVVHLGVDYGRVPGRRAWIAVAYVLAAIAAVLASQGALDGSRVLTAAPFVLGAAGVSSLLWFFARAYLAGRREALCVVVGATVLLAAVVNDLADIAHVLDTATLTQVGFVPFLFALSCMLLSRFWGVSEELRRSTLALRARTRELRKSYGTLRATQAELVRKEQLAVVGELAAVIAHEVRNPLAVVSNAVAGLKKTDLVSDDRTTLLKIVDEEVGRLNRLVTDLLGYARPVALQRSQLALDQLVERALGLARTKTGLTVAVEKRVEDARIWADPSHLRQVFDNLIDNAVQAMTGDGTLTVRLRADTIDGVDGLAVDVVDTGEGMDTMVRKRAKDPFFTTRPSGTGLGLAIVERIVDAHGGRFIIQSRAGEGTTATVFLPAGRPSEPPVSSSGRPPRRSERPHAARDGEA